MTRLDAFIGRIRLPHPSSSISILDLINRQIIDYSSVPKRKYQIPRSTAVRACSHDTFCGRTLRRRYNFTGILNCTMIFCSWSTPTDIIRSDPIITAYRSFAYRYYCTRLSVRFTFQNRKLRLIKNNYNTTYSVVYRRLPEFVLWAVECTGGVKGFHPHPITQNLPWRHDIIVSLNYY